MPTSLNLDNVTQALKEHYKPLTVKNMVYKDNPLLALMPKYERFGGENMPVPVQYGIANRRSADFATGQGLNTATELARFVLTRVRDYSFASITGETIKATEGAADAFLKYATLEIDGAIQSLTRSLAVAMYADGSGQLGTVTVAGTTLTMQKVDQITNIEVGMELNCAATATGAIRAGTTMVVQSVDRDAGSFVVDNAGACATNDFIFQRGDAQNGAGAPKKISGLERWLPSTAPTAGDSFFSQDRSKDATRLAGIRFPGANQPIEEALISAASRLAREGGSPSHCFMNFANFSNLEKALGSKVVYDKVSSDDADIGFQSLTIIGPKGPIQIVADQNCTPDVAYLLQMDTWTLNSLGDAPHILDLDGNRMLREASSDAYEVRVGFYGNIGCTAPGYNARVTLA
tara:strand:+ start:3163 stop:4374 length:1212 start_codon:yes stop_codon:yes gene_type:complete